MEGHPKGRPERPQEDEDTGGVVNVVNVFRPYKKNFSLFFDGGRRHSPHSPHPPCGLVPEDDEATTNHEHR
jgi:hypothetical protein